MNRETCFIAESFKLPGTGFHQTEFGGEPGSRVGEGNCFGFYGCNATVGCIVGNVDSRF